MVKEEIYDEHVKEWVKQNIEVVNITLKPKAQFIYEKEILEVFSKLYDDLTNKFDKIKDKPSGLTLKKFIISFLMSTK